MLGRKDKNHATGMPSFVLRGLTGLNQNLIRCAAWLQKRAGALTSVQLKLVLALFCLLLTGLSVYIVINSFVEKHSAFSIAPIRPMRLAEKQLVRQVITEKEYRRFHSLRLYLDSLSLSREGKVRFDSLLKQHPHLQDTLSYLEELYYQQHKN